MKIEASMSDQEFDKIEPYIECDDWANPMEYEFIFYNPSTKFLMMLALYDIIYYTDQE